MADGRKLEKTKTPGIYRRHNLGCSGARQCGCPYVVRYRAQGVTRKRLFDTWELAREFKASLSGKVRPRPLSAKTVAGYWRDWFPSYRGRTSRGLTSSTRGEYGGSFTRHIEPLPIARIKMRDVGPPEVRAWCEELERRGVSPRSIKHAKIALGLMFACALEDGAVSDNPARLTRYIPSAEAKRAHAKPEPKKLTAADVLAILDAMPEAWRAFFSLLAHTGVRVGELLGLVWGNVHLGDDPHLVVAEQVYKGERKEPKWGSVGKVKLSPGMAALLSELRPEDADADAPVFPSKTGTTLTYANVYNRVLRPALVRSGIAVQVGTHTVRQRGKDVELPVWDYQRVSFHAFRHALGSLLIAHGKQGTEVQGILRHAKLTTTMGIYVHPVEDQQSGMEILDEILPVGATAGATEHPETPADDSTLVEADRRRELEISEQPQTAAAPDANS
jgi:integrase